MLCHNANRRRLPMLIFLKANYKLHFKQNIWRLLSEGEISKQDCHAILDLRDNLAKKQKI